MVVLDVVTVVFDWLVVELEVHLVVVELVVFAVVIGVVLFVVGLEVVRELEVVEVVFITDADRPSKLLFTADVHWTG